MRNIVKSAFVRACVTFTVAMALWCAAGLVFAGPVEGIVITLSLLAAALALCALQAFWFTEVVTHAPELPRAHRRIRPDGPTGARPVRRAGRLVPPGQHRRLGQLRCHLPGHPGRHHRRLHHLLPPHRRQLRRRPRPLPRRPERVGHRDEKRLRRSSSALSPIYCSPRNGLGSSR